MRKGAPVTLPMNVEVQESTELCLSFERNETEIQPSALSLQRRFYHLFGHRRHEGVGRVVRVDAVRGISGL